MVINNKDLIPEGIWIISSFWFIGVFVLFVLGGIGLSLFDNFRVGGYSLLDPATQTVGYYISPMTFLSLGLLFIGIAILSYFVARGLLRANNWARGVVGILSLLGAVFAIVRIVKLNFAMGFLSLILHGLVVWYLFFKSSTNKFFKK
ncbi:MAG: hypothetical protein WC595_06710 [Candidatus Nanoarchaeia archaeon]